MKLLLDTHVLLWDLVEPEKLSPELRNALEISDNTLMVSAVTAWEIATKWRLGKLRHTRAVVEHYAFEGLWFWGEPLPWQPAWPPGHPFGFAPAIAGGTALRAGGSAQ